MKNIFLNLFRHFFFFRKPLISNTLAQFQKKHEVLIVVGSTNYRNKRPEKYNRLITVKMGHVYEIFIDSPGCFILWAS